ncbi:hypothetical protein M885DRAFT_614507 [Pelagophyceae sp. CCMP2097]|nr:hypothetical protein M885DRAFT_614507 [Pelagophyceae sp. CCMP2097]
MACVVFLVLAWCSATDALSAVAAPAARPAKPAAKPAPKPAQLFIANVDYQCSADELKAALEPVGVVSVDLFLDAAGLGRGLATATLRDGASLNDALAATVFVRSRELSIKPYASPVSSARRSASPRAIALNKLLADPETSAIAIVELFETRRGDFNDVNVATALYSFARRRGASRGASFDALVAAATEAAPRLEPRGLSNVVWAAAKLKVDDDALYDAVSRAAERKAPQFAAQALSNTAWAFATAERASPQLFESLARAAKRQLPTFKPQELSNMAWAFARVEFAGDEGDLFGGISVSALKALERFKPQEVANLVWAFSRLHFYDGELLRGVSNLCLTQDAFLGGCTSQNLANLLWAFATAGHADDALFQAVSTEASRRDVSKFTPQDHANICWSLAVFRIEDTAFLEAVAAKAVLEDFGPQALANTVWAFARCQVDRPDFFISVALRAAPQIQDFNPRELASTASAFAATAQNRGAGKRVEAHLDAAPTAEDVLFDAISAQVSARAATFGPQELTVTAAAFSRKRILAPKMYSAIAKAAVETIADFSAHELSTLARAFAVSGFEAVPLFEAVAFEAVGKIEEFTPRELSGLAWAFATAEISAPALFAAIAADSTPQRIASFDAKNIANTAWAAATAGVVAPVLFNTLAAAAVQRVGEFDAPALASTLWALAAAGAAARAMLFATVPRLSSLRAETEPTAASRESLAELHQLALYLRLEDLAQPGGESLAMPLGPQSLQFAQLSTAAVLADPKPPQDVLADVSAVLQDVGWDHVVHHVSADGLSLHLARPRALMAVEVLGPLHYLHDAQTPSGKVRFKKRLLERLGWRVAYVPAADWRKLDSQQARRLYLRRKLDALKKKAS